MKRYLTQWPLATLHSYDWTRANVWRRGIIGSYSRWTQYNQSEIGFVFCCSAICHLITKVSYFLDLKNCLLCVMYTVYIRYTYFVILWCTLESIPLISIELSFSICSNNDMTHRSSFVVHRPSNNNVWRLDMNHQHLTITQGQCSFESHFLTMSVTLLNMKRIKFSWCMPISNHISFVIFDIVIHSYLSIIIIISIPEHLVNVFIMIDYDNVAINSILKFFNFGLLLGRSNDFISFDGFPFRYILWHLISATRFAFINLLSFLTNKFTNVP